MQNRPSKGILFACNMNSVRSPMAEALAKELLGSLLKIDSVGAYQGGLDPFVPVVLEEVGLCVEDHQPKEFDAIAPDDFDRVIALTDTAAEAAARFFPDEIIELWQVPNPTDVYGNREQMLEAYRSARDELKSRILKRFCQ